MTESIAIRTENLIHSYRRKLALRDLSLSVPEGKVYGFLGLNGAGKSTAIRILMGLIRRRRGKAEVLGVDPSKDPVRVKSLVGYVAETHNFYEWMTVGETCAFVARYRPGWDADLAGSLTKKFDLDLEPKLSELSKGQRAKVSLLLALAFRPQLLILDEPTSGLDPSARREFFEGVLANYQQEGGTVFVSSHLVNEISGLVDHIGVIHEGAMYLEMPAEELRASVKRIRMVFDSGAPEDVIVCPGMLNVRKNGREAVLSVREFKENEKRIMQVLAAYEPSRVEVEDPNLEDILVELVGRQRGEDTYAASSSA